MRFSMDNGEEITRNQIIADFDGLDSDRQGRLAEVAKRLMAEQQVLSSTLPPIQCPLWCADVTGHAGEYLVEDQIHRSQGHRVSIPSRRGVVICAARSSEAPMAWRRPSRPR